MSLITHTSFRLRVKRKPQNHIFKHSNIKPWISAYPNIVEFENLIPIWILSITHISTTATSSVCSCLLVVMQENTQRQICVIKILITEGISM